MFNPSGKFVGFLLAASLVLLSACPLRAQSSNQIWFVSYNGAPNPGSDVSVRRLATDGSAASLPTGTATNFVCQTNFLSFNSPYDVAVDTAMGKVYVVDNNLSAANGQPEYIYSFDLDGNPAQVAASAQIIYTLPVAPADTNAGLYPLLSGLALDPVHHLLYFNQMDVAAPTNSYIGCLSLAISSKSDAFSSEGGDPTLQTFYVGQIPGQGPLAIDQTNFYIGAINGLNGNAGVYTAPISGTGSFAELVSVSSNDTTFTNGFVSGVAPDPDNHLIYYLTFTRYPYYEADTNQNAIWIYNTTNHTRTKIASGFKGYPDNIALDIANDRYYFTLGRDGTSDPVPTNHQAIFTGALGSTNAPVRLYTPALSSQDTGANAGNVAIGGIYIVESHPPPAAAADFINAQKNLPIDIPVAQLLTNDSDPDGGLLSVSAVSNTSTNGGNVSLGGGFVTYTPVNGFAGSDQFTYTLADSFGGQTQGVVTVNVLSLAVPDENHVLMTMTPDDNFLLFAGTSSQSYVVQYADSVTGPWHDLSPDLTAGTAGFIEYNDLLSPLPNIRFYRVRPGP